MVSPADLLNNHPILKNYSQMLMCEQKGSIGWNKEEKGVPTGRQYLKVNGNIEMVRPAQTVI